MSRAPSTVCMGVVRSGVVRLGQMEYFGPLGLVLYFTVETKSERLKAVLLSARGIADRSGEYDILPWRQYQSF